MIVHTLPIIQIFHFNKRVVAKKQEIQIEQIICTIAATNQQRSGKSHYSKKSPPKQCFSIARSNLRHFLLAHALYLCQFFHHIF